MRWKLALTALLAVIAVVVASIEFQLWNPRRASVETG